MSDAPILGGIQHITDIDGADDFQKKHTPYVACERDGDKVRVTIKVGHYFPHPNVADHFIEWVAVYAADAPVARFDFSAVATDPEVTCVLNVEAGTPIVAMESCNLHGLWTATTIAP